MRDVSALQAALAMAQMPSMVREARRAPLPGGMTFLLEIGAGDNNALSEAASLTNHDHERLRTAAGFYIEQILLTNNDDSLRVLGANEDTSAAELRRHMALLLKWLHPDVASHVTMSDQIDRSLFANRVTKAWEDLKTEDRRAAYALARKSASRGAFDKPLSRGGKQQATPQRRSGQTNYSNSDRRPSSTRRKPRGNKPEGNKPRGNKPEGNKARGNKPRVKRFSMHWLGRESLLNRLVLFLKGSR